MEAKDALAVIKETYEEHTRRLEDRLEAFALAQTQGNIVLGEAAHALRNLAAVEERKVQAMEQSLAFRREIVRSLLESRPFWGVVLLFALTLSFWLGLPPGTVDSLLAKLPSLQVTTGVQ